MITIKPVILQGRMVRLEPMCEAHIPDLAGVGLDPDIWRLMLYGEIQTEQDMRGWVLDILKRQSRGTDLPFVVIHHGLQRAIGATRYLNIEPAHNSLEIGGTWYGKEYQGTAVNPEAKYLLLKHAFETLGVQRVQFKNRCPQPALSTGDRAPGRGEGGCAAQTHGSTGRHSAGFGVLFHPG